MKEAETRKTRKAESKGTNLTTETSLLHKMKDIEKLTNSISNMHIRLVAIIEDTDKLQNLFYIYTRTYNNSIVAILRQIDSLVEGDIIVGQEASAVKEEVIVEEENVRVEVVNEKAEEENIEIEATDKESIEDIVNASEFLDATNDNQEYDGARPVEAAEVTSEEHYNSLAIMVYTRPLKVTPHTQEAVDDAEAAPKTEERSEDHEKPIEKKKKCSKD
ncbi:hypothetical protein PVK06_035211 [Gossypium arboreum]|uniref:Uncharacterized protein n=1 Tax=Gossypium arboreum TaxID=29729 RepID=A0ABR0NGP7_GOSAR|nr:hypothetical protein PVK06_035211 [Gossypium arboreum]